MRPSLFRGARSAVPRSAVPRSAVPRSAVPRSAVTPVVGLLAVALLCAGCALGDSIPVVPVARPAPVQAAPTGADEGGRGGQGGGVSAWGVAANTAHATVLTRQTCRVVVRPTVDGSGLRLRLTNRLGDRPLKLGAVQVAPVTVGPAVQLSDSVPVTVNGALAFQVPAGASALSDRVALPVRAGVDLAVSFFVPGSDVQVTERVGGPSVGWCSPPGSGNQTVAGALPFTVRGGFARVVDDVVVTGGAARGTLVGLGDSLTTTTLPAETHASWTDDYARRTGGRVAVVNAAISGNRLTVPGGNGQPGTQRLAPDVLTRSGVRALVVLEGTNDIRGGASAAEVVGGLQRVVTAAQQARLTVLLCTLPPWGGSKSFDLPGHDYVRREVNSWIRGGSHGARVLDVDALVRSPGNPSTIAAPYHQPDRAHLSPAGEALVAGALPLDLVR